MIGSWRESSSDFGDGRNRKENVRELHLFAGAGGGILGGMLLGHTCVCAVEIEPYCRKVLLQRQRDGILPKFPIWDDVRTFDGRPWRGLVDVVCGGFPCQDISQTNPKAIGIKGARSGLWTHMRRVVCEVRPRFVFVENTPTLTSRGLDCVLRDLAALGYDAKWGVFSASDVGAQHIRERIWIFAHANPRRWQRAKLSTMDERYGGIDHSRRCARFKRSFTNRWPTDKPGVGRIIDGLPYCLDRVRAIGNGQVPAVVKLAWETLSQ